MQRLAALVLALSLCARYPKAQTTVILVDVSKNQRPISPLIYGVSFANSSQLADLNAPINRQGGDTQSTYNCGFQPLLHRQARAAQSRPANSLLQGS